MACLDHVNSVRWVIAREKEQPVGQPVQKKHRMIQSVHHSYTVELVDFFDCLFLSAESEDT
jgi:hypothetical protein